MATVIRAWTVDGDKLLEIPELPPEKHGFVEQKLEEWLVSQPDAIDDDLLVIGRQVQTASGPLDLLGLTADGQLVVVELKRDRAPREAVAQAIDYASWIAGQTADDIRAIATGYLGRPLEDAFEDRFGGETLPDLQMESPSILVVASRLDASTERMIEFLAQQYGMDVDGLVFRYLRLPEAGEFLIRTSVVTEERRISAGAESRRVPIEALVALAGDRRGGPILAILRRLREFLGEEPAKSYGGSFRYWRGRLLCGVNAASYWGAPEGAIDVWVSYGNWVRLGGFTEELLKEALRSKFELVKEYDRAEQMILRIETERQAADFVSLLNNWAEEGWNSSDGVRNAEDGSE